MEKIPAGVCPKSAGLSGVYDVQYSQDAGASWADLLAGTTATQITFETEPGVTVLFRVRATDRVGNEGYSPLQGPYRGALQITKYYHFAGARVAMRQCVVDKTCKAPVYLHGDHLGSVSLATDAQGGLLSQSRYTPYGEQRWPVFSMMPTDFGYTGQRENRSFNLTDYNARYYSPHLGRFISADTDVPESQGVQALDRYAFVNNNPIRWIDPSGHSIDCGIGDPNCRAGVIVPRIVSRGEWGAMEPGNHRNCSDLGACVSTGYNEGAYDAATNPSGYAEYSQLYPDQSLADVLNTAVIHHEGDFQDYSVQGVQRSHMYERGWMDIGYHYVIGTDGTIYEGRSISARGTHVAGGNSGKIGILFLGDFNPGMEVGTLNLPFDLYNGDDFGPTGAQLSSAMLLLEWLDNTYGIDSVVGHGDIPGQNTRCPGSYCQPYVERFNNAFGNSAK